MRPTRSLTRFSIGTEGSRNICALAPTGSMAAITKRHPATFTAIPLPLQLLVRQNGSGISLQDAGERSNLKNSIAKRELGDSPNGAETADPWLSESIGGEIDWANEFDVPRNGVAVGHSGDEIAHSAQLLEPIARTLPRLGQQGWIVAVG